MSEHEDENGQGGLDHDELLALVRSSFGAEDDGPYRLLVRTAPEIMELPEPPESYRLLGPLVFRGSRTIVLGDTGHGKTSFALQMLAAILHGDEMLSWSGSGTGPALVVDLEQGIRSIKRGIRESKLEDDPELLYVTVPDGLALDKDPEHFTALSMAIHEHNPAVVLLDPFYKAHRADEPNAERPIIDLMRMLDSLRVTFGFALILPAHPRKDVAGARDGARKLTIHDVAGSGAVTRGAEIVIAVERMGHGYARLRYLKDRDGELPVGDSLGMLYTKADGFHIDPRSTETDEGVEAKIAETSFGWATTREWAKELHVQHARVARILEALADRSLVALAIGPPGRSAKARCYSTVLEHREQSGTVQVIEGLTVTVPTVPPLKGGTVDTEQSVGPPLTSKSSDRNPLLDFEIEGS